MRAWVRILAITATLAGCSDEPDPAPAPDAASAPAADAASDPPPR